MSSEKYCLLKEIMIIFLVETDSIMKIQTLHQRFLRTRKRFKNLRSMALALRPSPTFQNMAHPTLVRWAKSLEEEKIGGNVRIKIEQALDFLDAQNKKSASDAVTGDLESLLQETSDLVKQAQKFLRNANAIQARLKAALEK
jgi:hypothetical protein